MVEPIPPAIAPDGEQTEQETVNYSYLPQLVGHLLGLAHLRVTQICTDLLTPLKLTPKQFITLEFVSNNPEVSQKDIAMHVGTTPPVMVSILDDLSKRKLLRRARSPHDRRVQFVQVTEKGSALLDQIRDIAFEVEDRYAEETHLTDKERAALLKILQKMTNRCPPESGD